MLSLISTRISFNQIIQTAVECLPGTINSSISPVRAKETQVNLLIQGKITEYLGLLINKLLYSITIMASRMRPITFVTGNKKKLEEVSIDYKE